MGFFPIGIPPGFSISRNKCEHQLIVRRDANIWIIIISITSLRYKKGKKYAIVQGEWLNGCLYLGS
jgi:hypothetical protein